MGPFIVMPEYVAWYSATQRCFNPKSAAFQNYGGRGISMCHEWRSSFYEFLAYIGWKPSRKHVLDRINNDGNYEPGNVRWATYSESNTNKRKSVKKNKGDKHA